MASIHKDILLDAHPNDVWAAVRDFGSPHRRLVPGFVLDARLDGDARIVTFANGTVARELLVDCDDTRRRLAYAAVSERLKQHSASVQVTADGEARSRLTWAQRNRALYRGPDGSGRAGDAESAGAQRCVASQNDYSLSDQVRGVVLRNTR
jgi:Polyketide cyclase / dehydrase and lipid transport